MGVARTVLVDLDGVLADFEGAVAARVLADHGFLHTIHPRDRRGFSFVDDYTARFGAGFAAGIKPLMHEAGFYETLRPLPGAVDGVGELIARGWHVVICTAPSLTNPTCASDKFRWVATHLGDEHARRVVVTKDKTLVAGRFLLDDNPEVSGAHPPVWTHLLVGTPANTGVEHPERHDGWPALLARVGMPRVRAA